ncbi:MAG: QueT transporter family protein [Clostridia bacterium]|nr:QueT transporter family protein [Clostridia bacterium]
MKRSTLNRLTLGALIAALYAAFTTLSASMGLAIGIFEFRLSEALVVLPLFTPAAVPGLFCGCILANILCGAHVIDIVLGSLATLLGALGTRALRKKPLLALIPPVAANALLIPPVLYFVYGLKNLGFPLLFFSFLVGEAATAGGLGFLLYRALRPFQRFFQ